MYISIPLSPIDKLTYSEGATTSATMKDRRPNTVLGEILDQIEEDADVENVNSAKQVRAFRSSIRLKHLWKRLLTGLQHLEIDHDHLVEDGRPPDTGHEVQQEARQAKPLDLPTAHQLPRTCRVEVQMSCLESILRCPRQQTRIHWHSATQHSLGRKNGA